VATERAGTHIRHVAPRPLAADTSPEAEAVRFDLYRRMSPAEKARRVAELTAAASRYALAGLRQRYPAASAQALWLRLAALRLGADVVERAYGWRPERDGP